MSTANTNKFAIMPFIPAWTRIINEFSYHQAASSGEYVSSTMLREFRLCPAQYRDIVAQKVERQDTDAFRFGRALHVLLLEGETVFRSRYAIGGPYNERTGRSYSPDSKAFDQWLEENGFLKRQVVTDSEFAVMQRMVSSARAHEEIARLLSEGWPELSARSVIEDIQCQARLDWLRSDAVAVDVKTTSDIGRFESDARRFGYLHQFAFYRDVCRAAGAGEIDMIAAVVEKKAPFRSGVWHFSADTLEPYAVENRTALRTLACCRETNAWPTGYERLREFPLSGLPRVWLN